MSIHIWPPRSFHEDCRPGSHRSVGRGGEQGKLGTPEEAAEQDINAQEKADRELKELFDQIRAALVAAKTIAQLQTAWSLTSGKKTRLDDVFFTQLQAIKGSRKAELLEVA